MSEEPVRPSSIPAVGILVNNLGEPILLSGLELDAVAAEAAQKGSSVNVWTRLSLTSDEAIFHRIARSLADHLEFRAREASNSVNLARADTTLLVIRPDNSGELWLDAAAVSINIVAKRSIETGMLVFERDIADVTGMSFPMVQIGEADRVVCLFREGWRFALFFDFNPERKLSLVAMERDLGTLYRRLRYRKVYDAIASATVFGRLVQAGWFPFAEIIGTEFEQLSLHCESDFDLADVEAELVAKFDTKRLEQMFARWMVKPHFAGKERLLRSALKGYLAGDPVPVLKIVLTEIEGILNDAHRKLYGTGAKQKALLAFAVRSAEEKRGHPDTLMFPAAFGRYLAEYTFANFDPEQGGGTAGSRHAVGHGAAESGSYTQTRALQALLTLDQLAFFT
ncbi:hypothetical protein [Stappia sp. TSB10P1A]|uniref:hypothetical protein n=1 Tax=Stappia sp. TSB10P1A TaxID=2003585 RepID=UPI001AD8F987|nr:hypothetical protein [Stappia sp. TSB10P1A]